MGWKFGGLGNSFTTPDWELDDRMEEARDAERERELKKRRGKEAEIELQAIAERRARRQRRGFWTRMAKW